MGHFSSHFPDNRTEAETELSLSTEIVSFTSVSPPALKEKDSFKKWAEMSTSQLLMFLLAGFMCLPSLWRVKAGIPLLFQRALHTEQLHEAFPWEMSTGHKHTYHCKEEEIRVRPFVATLACLHCAAGGHVLWLPIPLQTRNHSLSPPPHSISFSRNSLLNAVWPLLIQCPRGLLYKRGGQGKKLLQQTLSIHQRGLQAWEGKICCKKE